MNNAIEKLEKIIDRLENTGFPEKSSHEYDCYGCCGCCGDYSDFEEDIANKLKEVLKELKGGN